MFQRATPVVQNIIIINALMFVATYSGIIPSFADIMAGHYPLSSKFQPWQIVTHMFMHGGLSHIFFNMFGVYIFGSMLEKVWGSKRFLIYYMLTGLGAFALHYFMAYLELRPLAGALSEAARDAICSGNFDGLTGQDAQMVMSSVGLEYNMLVNTPVVGASGAVFGLLIAFGLLFPNTELYLLFIPIPIKAKWLAVGYGAFELFQAYSNRPGDNVAHFAHLGGMLFGYLILKIWQHKRNSFY